MSDVRTFSTDEFALLVKRKPRTLYAWARSGKLIPKKDFSNRNVYTEDDYKKVTNRTFGYSESNN